MAKLAPLALTWLQLTSPCQPETSKPWGWDLLSKLEGLALTRPRIDAKMTAEDFMMRIEEAIWRFCVLIVDMRFKNLDLEQNLESRQETGGEFQSLRRLRWMRRSWWFWSKKMSRLVSPSYTFAEVVLYLSFEDSRDISRLPPMPTFCRDEALNRSGRCLPLSLFQGSRIHNSFRKLKMHPVRLYEGSISRLSRSFYSI